MLRFSGSSSKLFSGWREKRLRPLCFEKEWQGLSASCCDLFHVWFHHDDDILVAHSSFEELPRAAKKTDGTTKDTSKSGVALERFSESEIPWTEEYWMMSVDTDHWYKEFV